MSLKAAAAASARFETTTAIHPYAPVGDKGLLVDTLDMVRRRMLLHLYIPSYIVYSF